MPFKFQKPSIHDVKNITAYARTIQSGDGFACLSIVFHGSEGEPQEMDVFFPAAHINKAHAIAAVINVLTPHAVDQEAA